MALTAAEQYMLELINRARLDPAAEAARLGISLNQGLQPDQLGTHARYVLAPNLDLEESAHAHSRWMLSTDVFSHTGANGSSAIDRMRAAGYGGGGWGENISWTGTTGTPNLNAMIGQQHDSLFRSSGHRVNLMTDWFREIGVGQDQGQFTYQGTHYNTSMVTQNFGRFGPNVFITGVTYNDANRDGFYTIGEGAVGGTFTVSQTSAFTSAAGGYSLALAPTTAAVVTGAVANLAFSVTLNVGLGNAKLDVVNSNTFHSSANITLGTGIERALLLGVGDLTAVGSGAANHLTGNKGNNLLSGLGGDDTLLGAAGNDSLHGGIGQDSVSGDSGHDLLRGNAGNDVLTGGAGRDRLYGDTGNDVLSGGADGDSFIFQKSGGMDRITDFTSADQILIDDAIWGGTAKTTSQVVQEFGETILGGVRLDFDNGQTITITGITSLGVLVSELTIF